jgi:phosphotransacetylase
MPTARSLNALTMEDRTLFMADTSVNKDAHAQQRAEIVLWPRSMGLTRLPAVRRMVAVAASAATCSMLQSG